MNETGGTPKSPFLFAGRWYEADAGIYYYRARHYHPELRTFLQPDPLGYEDGMNWYAYVHNNPVNYWDPDGTIAWIPVIGAALGAVYNGYNNWTAWQSGEMSNVEYAGSIALGAVTGALSTLGTGLTSSLAIGGLSTGANEAGNQLIRSNQIEDWQAVALETGIGSIGAGLGVGVKSFGRNFILLPAENTIPVRSVYDAGDLGALVGSYLGNTVGDSVVSPLFSRYDKS